MHTLRNRHVAGRRRGRLRAAAGQAVIRPSPLVVLLLRLCYVPDACVCQWLPSLQQPAAVTAAAAVQ